MAFSLRQELLRACFYFELYTSAPTHNSLRVFRSDRSYSTYFCSQRLAQTRGTPLAFRSIWSYFAPFACATRSFVQSCSPLLRLCQQHTIAQQGFHSDRSYSTYIFSQRLAQTRGTPLAFHSDKSYLAPFAFATRSSLSPMGYLEEMSMSVALGYLQLAAC